MANSGQAIPRSNAISWVGVPILLAWFAYLLIAPTIGFGWIESWHNEQRAVQIALLTCTAIAYCVVGWSARSQTSVDRWQFSYLFLPFVALGVLSALRAQFVLAALAEVSMFVLLAMLAMLTAQFVAKDVERAVRWARWFALLFSTAYVLGVATRYFAAVTLERTIDLDVLILGYANPRFPSALHAVLIPFLALTVIEKTELRSLRVGAAAVLSLLWAINLGLGTRGIWFAYCVGVPLTILLVGWRNVWRPLTVLALSAVAGVALYFILFSITPAVIGTGAAVQAPTDNLTTLTSREVLWNLSWQAIKSAPLLGIGPMQFATLDSRAGSHPHNWPLQIAAEWGLPALGILAIALLKLGKAVRHTVNRNDSFSVIILAVAVALALGFVDGNLIMPVSQIGATLAVGLLIGVSTWREKVEEQVRSSGSSVMLALLLGTVACGIVAVFGKSSFVEQPQSTAAFQKRHLGAWIVPRFWEQGALR